MSILPDIDDAQEEARPKVSQDVADAIELLLWAREKGFAIPVVKIGSLQLRVDDLRQAKREGMVAPPRGDIYAEHMEGLDP